MRLRLRAARLAARLRPLHVVLFAICFRNPRRRNPVPELPPQAQMKPVSAARQRFDIAPVSPPNHPALREYAQLRCGGCGRNQQRCRPARFAPGVLREFTRLPAPAAISQAVVRVGLASAALRRVLRSSPCADPVQKCEPQNAPPLSRSGHRDLWKFPEAYHNSCSSESCPQELRSPSFSLGYEWRKHWDR